ncbi:MAG TPA: thioesterase family protein [Flavobacteriaceae bacterium]|nr:thioesterase family protein [Flavobacteriaceae bacterium]
MKKDYTKLRVRYSETDQMGIVHHGNYPQYFELARIRWLESIGISYKQMEKEGIMLPVYEMKIKYLIPAYFDEILEVETFLMEKPTVKIKIGYIIRNHKKETLTEGETTLVFMDSGTRKPIRCPAYIKEKLR